MKYGYSSIGFVTIIGGIIGAAFLKLPSFIWLIGGLLAICFGIIRLLLNRTIQGWLIIGVLLCLSAFWFAENRQMYLRQFLLNRSWNEKSVTVEGVVVERLVESEPGKFHFTIKVTGNSGGTSKSPRGKIVIYTSGKKPQDFYGRKIRLTGKFLGSRYDGKVIPKFDEKRKILGRMWLKDEPKIFPGKGLPWYFMWAHRLRNNMIRVGEENLSVLNRHFLHGMLFGEDLWDEGEEGLIIDNLRKTGTIHLLTVSGLHIGFVVVSLNYLLGLLKVQKGYRFIILVTGVWFYILMTGLEPPVLRAGWMLLFMMAAKLFGTHEDQVNFLCLSGIVLLVINPYNIFEAGFQLSFLATFGVVWLFPILRSYYPVKHRIGKWVWEGLLVSVSAQLIILPVLIENFQQISWLSPLFNLFIIIPANFIVLGGLIGELGGILIPWIGTGILIVVGWFIEFTRWGIGVFAEIPMAFSWSPRWPWPWICGFYLGLLLMLDIMKPNLVTKTRKLPLAQVLIIILIVGNLAVWGSYLYKLQGPFLEIDVIDVGQGDAILLSSPDGAYALIDGGDEGAGKRKVLPRLREKGISGIDLCFASHGHRDHIGGLDEVLERIYVQNCYVPEKIDWDSHVVRDFISKLRRWEVPVIPVANGTEFRLGKTVRIQTFQAPGNLSENDNSLVLRVEYGKKVILLTGDLSAKGEEIFIRKHPHLLRAAVLKVGHHGSNFATLMPYLTQIRPKAAVISVGDNNRFGHPGEATLNRLRSLGVKVFRTDRNSSVTIRLYQERITITPRERNFYETHRFFKASRR